MNTSGIYQIKNIVNNNIYIGSTINLIRRKSEHFNLLRKNKHSNKHLQYAFNKYGKNSFEFITLVCCDKKNCLLIEQMFINEFNPVYNINPTAGNSLGVKHSKETIEKIKKSKLGHFVSEETKKKQRESNLLVWKNRGENYRKGLKLKKNHVGLTENQKKLLKPIIQLSLNGEVIKKWDGCNQIMRDTGYCATHISRCCNEKKKTAYGYKWRFITN